jgi:hypothetical protein
MSRNVKQAEFQQNTFGGGGFVLVDDTTDTSGTFIAIQAVGGDAEFNSVTQTNEAQITDNFTLSDGGIIYGNFITQFQLASGAVLAYRAQEAG